MYGMRADWYRSEGSNYLFQLVSLAQRDLDLFSIALKFSASDEKEILICLVQSILMTLKYKYVHVGLTIFNHQGHLKVSSSSGHLQTTSVRFYSWVKV